MLNALSHHIFRIVISLGLVSAVPMVHAASAEELFRVQERLQRAAAPWCERLAKLDEQGRRRCTVAVRNWGPAGGANAFAFLGNASVTGELLVRLSEDELALVAGHEFAHLVLGHAVMALRGAAQSGSAGAAMMLTLAEGSSVPPHEDTPADAQQMELDADKLGLYLAGLAGYRVGSLAPLWRDAAKRLPGWEHGAKASASHPSHGKREQAARAAAQQFCDLLRRKRTVMPAEPRLQPRYEMAVDELIALQTTVDAAQVCPAGAPR